MLKVDSKNRKILFYIFLLVYGLIASYLIVKSSRLAHPYGDLENYYMSLRLEWLNMFINEVKNTGLYTGLHRLFDHNSAIYLYLSHIGNIFNLDAAYTFFYTQLGVVFLGVALYPFLIYRACGNKFIALMSIFFFKLFDPFCIYLQNDSYWIYGRAIFISMPIFYFLFKEKWKNTNYIWIAALVGLAAVSNVFRGSSAIVILFNLVLLLAVKVVYPSLKDKKYKNIIPALIMCCIAFRGQNLLTSTVPNIYQSITGQPRSLPLKGPWHSLYIGLGWEENPYGLEYLDAFGYDGREYLLYDISDGYYIGIESPQYIRQMKEVYFDTILKDPVFFLSSYIRKFLTAIQTALSFSLINPVFLLNRYFYINKLSIVVYVISFASVAACMYKDYKNKSLKKYIPFAAILFLNTLIGFLPSIVATPIVREYMFGAIGCMDLIVLYGYLVLLNLIYKQAKEYFSKRFNG